MKIRLQVFLARSGAASSRRRAEDLIRAGKIKINGKPAKLGDKVEPDTDLVQINGEKVEKVSKKVYVMLNKPKGYLVAKSDSRGRKLAYDLLKQSSVSGEKLSELEFSSLFNVGRLDLNTEGLILFTNDGEFAQKITHPRHGVKKVYIAKVDGRITNEAVEKMEKGVTIKVEEGGETYRYKSAPATIKILGRGKENYSILLIKISEGRKREIRRMCEAVGFPVLELKRIQIGSLELGDLPVGKWRFIKPAEISKF